MLTQTMKTAVMMGGVGAGAVFALRKFAPSIAASTVSAPGPTPTGTPIPGIMPSKDGFGAEWVLIPAAIGWFLTK